MKIYLVIPAFNEEKDLLESFSNLRTVFESSDYEAHYHFVNDGSTDGTQTLLGELQKKYSNVYVSDLPLNKGKGFAVMFGLNNAFLHDCDVFGYVDADLDLNPENFPVMISKLLHGTSHVIVGNKLDHNSVVEYPFKRRVMSYLYRKLTKTLLDLDVPDTQTGVKFFTASVLNDVAPKVKAKSFSFDLEFLSLAVRAGYSIDSSPVILKHRFNSSISLQNSLHAIVDLIKIRHALRKNDK